MDRFWLGSLDSGHLNENICSVNQWRYCFSMFDPYLTTLRMKTMQVTHFWLKPPKYWRKTCRCLFLLVKCVKWDGHGHGQTFSLMFAIRALLAAPAPEPLLVSRSSEARNGQCSFDTFHALLAGCGAGGRSHRAAGLLCDSAGHFRYFENYSHCSSSSA